MAFNEGRDKLSTGNLGQVRSSGTMRYDDGHDIRLGRPRRGNHVTRHTRTSASRFARSNSGPRSFPVRASFGRTSPPNRVGLPNYFPFVIPVVRQAPRKALLFFNGPAAAALAAKFSPTSGREGPREKNCGFSNDATGTRPGSLKDPDDRLVRGGLDLFRDFRPKWHFFPRTVAVGAAETALCPRSRIPAPFSRESSLPERSGLFGSPGTLSAKRPLRTPTESTCAVTQIVPVRGTHSSRRPSIEFFRQYLITSQFHRLIPLQIKKYFSFSRKNFSLGPVLLLQGNISHAHFPIRSVENRIVSVTVAHLTKGPLLASEDRSFRSSQSSASMGALNSARPTIRCRVH